jgi:hypothetical protein
LWADTDIRFQGLLQPVTDMLRDLFSQKDPEIYLSAHVEVEKELNYDMLILELAFRGSLEGINVDFADVMMFHNMDS